MTRHEPHYGHTKHGLPVHLHTADHLPAGKLNRWLAVKVTTGVGTMWCAYAFAALALISLPQAIQSHNAVTLVSWISQTFLQLVLLSVIIVGQNVQAQASDARAGKTFDDVEALRSDQAVALDRLDEKTEGGIKAVLDAVSALAAQVADRPTRAVQMQSAITLDETQIKQLVAAIQANLLAQAKRNGGNGPKATGA